MSLSSSSDGLEALRPFRIPHLPPSFYYIANFITPEEEASILQKIPAQRWVTLSHRRLQAHPSTLTPGNTLLGASLPPYLATPIVERFRTLGVFGRTPHRAPNHVLINEYRAGEGIMPHEDGGAYAGVVATVSLGGAVCLDVDVKTQTEKEDGGATSAGSTAAKDDEAVKEEDGMADKDDARGFETRTRSSQPFGTSAQYKLPARILQEPRSLLITTSSAYTDLLHGIAPVEVDEDLSPDTVANWYLLAAPYVFEENGGRNERLMRTSLTYRDVLKVSSAASKVLGGGRR